MFSKLIPETPTKISSLEVYQSNGKTHANVYFDGLNDSATILAEQLPMIAKCKWYVGCKKSGEYEAFKSPIEPTQESHGNLYFAVIGPFRTMRGAKFMAEHGKGNPHLRHVNDAERIAKQYQQ